MAIETERILLIHPEPQELTFLLQHSGFQVVSDTENQALAEVSMKEPDVIIMAEALAKSNGDELCMRIRELCEAPIIILGQHRETRVGIHFLEAGADTYLPSPLSPGLLLAWIHSLLRRSKDVTRGVMSNKN